TDQVIITVNPAPPPGVVDYELLGMRVEHATVGEAPVVHIRYRNVGTAEGSALAELFIDGAKLCAESVTDLVGDGPGKASLPATCDFSFTFPAVGDYVVEVGLTSDTGTDVLTKTASIKR
ncbi:MAG: hypothetical protein ACE5JM_13760, partial [Armatimonadota bacterium]